MFGLSLAGSFLSWLTLRDILEGLFTLLKRLALGSERY